MEFHWWFYQHYFCLSHRVPLVPLAVEFYVFFIYLCSNKQILHCIACPSHCMCFVYIINLYIGKCDSLRIHILLLYCVPCFLLSVPNTMSKHLHRYHIFSNTTGKHFIFTINQYKVSGIPLMILLTLFCLSRRVPLVPLDGEFYVFCIYLHSNNRILHCIACPSHCMCFVSIINLYIGKYD